MMEYVNYFVGAFFAILMMRCYYGFKHDKWFNSRFKKHALFISVAGFFVLAFTYKAILELV